VLPILNNGVMLNNYLLVNEKYYLSIECISILLYFHLF
jgi:hypothetical protein